ncbi:antibiotic biosynthesis monooxygenase [Fulvimarina sp. MAC3]|uniref:putative quinol monooxygenase n=1 Tax=Fulvimarina sp. MAC3 TaxID=3148887 RepID=UPI0031FC7485
MYALFLKHKARPGCRDDLEAAWRRHMLPAIEGNPGHLAYTYSFANEADVVAAFQVYRSKDDADAFVRSPAYLAYLRESRPLLTHEPEVMVLEPRWTKG